MAAKVDEKTLKRLLELKGIGLTDNIISQRLGISERTVRVYTRADRTKTAPYRPDQAIDVPSSDNSETSR